MIFVTVGMHYKGFERLIIKVDEIAESIDEEIIAQIGSSKYIPKNANYFDFIDDDKILDYFKKARIIISHAGAGTLLSVLVLGKPLIVVPRMKKFGEAFDDQQLELAEMIFTQKKAIAVYNVDELENALRDVETLGHSILKSDNLINYLRESIRVVNR